MKVRDVISTLIDAGFLCVRVKGSHATYRHEDGRVMTVVVNHKNADATMVVIRSLRATLDGTRAPQKRRREASR